jgi:hypothetical protein
MSLIPDTTHGTIQYLESKVEPWTSNSTAIGTTSAAVTAMDGKLTVAKEKLANQVAAHEQAKTATAELNAAIRDLRRAGSDIIKQIRAKAATTGDGVYFLAQIPAPAAPTPVPPPGTPTDFTATLNPDGSLKLRWKCANPRGAGGTMYQVSRRVGAGGASGPFVALGGSGTKTFLDATVPASAAAAGGVTYQVQAVRSTAVGVAAQFVVNFGCAPGGETVASVMSAQGGPKLAA